MLAQQFISEPCSWFHREENYAKALLIEKLSGIGLNRMGSPDQCLSDPTLRYFLIKYNIASLQPTFYTGLCYSSNCTASDLIYITKSVNEYIPLPFENFTIFEPYTESNSWNSYAITIIILLAVLVVLGVLATLAEKCGKTAGQKWKKFMTVFSFRCSVKFMFQKCKNNQRIKIIAGLRAFAFLGMTFYNMAFALMEAPSMPQPSNLSKYVKVMYFYYDLWLAISGFYLFCQLYKYWSKDASLKNVLYTFLRKLLKTVSISAIAILAINSIVHTKFVSPLWNLAYIYFDSKCHLFNIFGECNYWLWLWAIEIQMCLLASLLFVLWQSKFRFSKACYLAVNLVFLAVSLVLALGFGDTNQGLGSLQGSIMRCPLLSGASYVLGFNLGLLYLWFRTHRNKSKILVVRIFKYKINRIATSLLAIAALILIHLYFYSLQDQMAMRTDQVLIQVFRMVAPLCYCLLILPQMLGFENIWGALLKDRFMNVASRLSFSSYTVYYGVCMVIINSLQEDLYINFSKLVCVWMCSVLLSLGVGFLLCALAEIPLYRALHAWLGRSSPRAYIEFY